MTVFANKRGEPITQIMLDDAHPTWQGAPCPVLQ